MIAHLYGNVISRTGDESLILHCNGVGYEVRLGPTCLPLKLQVNDTAQLFVWHVTNDAGQTLYGFPDAQARDLAQQVAETPGIGPVTAHRFVTSIGWAGIAEAVQANTVSNLPKVKGVGGGKVAEIILTLRKLGRVTALADPRVPKAVAALKAIGCTHPELLQLATHQAKIHPEMDVSSLVKNVLIQANS